MPLKVVRESGQNSVVKKSFSYLLMKFNLTIIERS